MRCTDKAIDNDNDIYSKRKRKELIEFELVFIDLLGLLESEASPFIAALFLQLVNILGKYCWRTFSSFLVETFFCSASISFSFAIIVITYIYRMVF